MATPQAMAPVDPKPPVGRKDMYKAFAASLTGTALEFYDFAVYSAAAAIVFPLIFFPASDPVTGTLLAFSTYAVGYISRPVGGIIFGRLGDEIGRKKILVITLMLIGVATFLIGLLPTYDNIGIIAPAILVFLRFAQGVGVGGEWGGAVLLSSEFGDPNTPRILGLCRPDRPARRQPHGQRRTRHPDPDACPKKTSWTSAGASRS